MINNLQVEGTKEYVRLRKYPQQITEESGQLVAQYSEDGMTKMKIMLKFSAGHCSIQCDYQLINNSNLDLIIEVENMILDM